jgi:alkylation response protein AidB-like acyl-CoA dehydrogenase
MAEKTISERNLKFLLYEVFDAESLLRYPRFADHNREVFDMVFDMAMRMGEKVYKPLFAEMDRNQPQYINGEVKVHPAIRDILREMGAGGWIASTMDYELGGQQLPAMVGLMIPGCVFASANYSACVYHGLTGAAAALIMNYGSKALQKTYLPKMMTGEWQGTTALTEPQAGSSLSDITTEAEPTDQGYYKIKGQKIFITAGDHDSVDNIVHLMLGRIKGAPAGVKGISLFLVPKKRVEAAGELVFNDVHCTGIYQKLGYRGCPLTQLSFGENDDCRGWLIGEANKGLACMFLIIDAARIDTGMAASSIASAAYHASLEYAKNRLQGRKLFSKDPLSPQIPLIEHPDVRRMLLFQRAVVEGSHSLLMHCCLLEDLMIASDGEEKENAHLLLDLLIPVAKSYPAEMAILSCSQGLQILGGYGYCDEFPLEQFYRDVRIHPIHEGATAIQAQDLLGRKMIMEKGKAAKLYYREVGKTIKQAMPDSELKMYAQEMEKALAKLEQVSGYLFGLATQGNVELFLADATLYLEFFGIITMGWQWLIQAIAAKKALNLSEGISDDVNFYEGKLCTCRYFFVYELPKIESLAISLTRGSSLTVDIQNDYFEE